MATGDKRINFYLKKFLSVDQVNANWFQYLLARIVDIFVRLFPQSGIWEPWPIPLTGGTANDTFTVASGSDVVMQDNEVNLLELDSSEGVDIPFENATGVDYYVGAKYIEIPDSPETNPRYNTPQWKLVRDAVGELDDPDSVTDQGGGVFRFVVNSVTESGIDHSGRVCRIYLKTPNDLGNNYEEATIVYGGGNNYVDISTGGDLGDISTDETLYSAVVEGYTWKRNTNLSALPEYAFIGIVTGNGPGAIPTVFNTSGQYRLDSSILSLASLIAAFQLEHNYSPGSGDHSAITVDSIDAKAVASLPIKADENIILGYDNNNDASGHLSIEKGVGSSVLFFENSGDVRFNSAIGAKPNTSESLIRRDVLIERLFRWKYGLAARNTSKSAINVSKGLAIIGEDLVEITSGAGANMTVNAGTIYSAGSTFGRRSGDSWSADTWYFIYITKDYGTPPTFGLAYSSSAPNNLWYHPSDSNWRCIGAFKTDSTPEVLDFYYLPDGTCFLGLWDYGRATPSQDHNLIWLGAASSATWTQLSSDGTFPPPSYYFPTISEKGMINFWSGTSTPTNFRWRPYNQGYWRTNTPTDYDSGIPFAINPAGNNDVQMIMPLGADRDAEFEQIGTGTTRFAATGYIVEFGGICPLV